ncbi:MAG: hydantoinase/oxoprolinase family protein, partial [Chloroflexia bacterium]
LPDDLRWEVAERLDAAGQVLVPLDEEAVDKVASRAAAEGVESLAIVFLFAFRNPAHERRAAERIRARWPHLVLSLSSEILPEYREYERTATTVVNAYVAPLVGRYLERLAGVLPERSIRVMQSNGGVTSPEQAAAQAARLVLSGPAGGVVGAFFIARESQPDPSIAPHILTLDMGGTSTDVALCPGTVPYTPENTVAGVPLRLPAVDVHTVGAGGGSLAWVDAAGVLHVGPQSAGGVPGPVCYGRGGRTPTVTDAHLVLGRLHPAYFLGGRGDVSLDLPAARSALARLGQELGGLSAEEVALGVIRVANATMERALRYVSVERGYDPRRFTLLPFGGAGPLHACALAEALGIPHILVPPHPGVLSALGLVVADAICDTSRSLLCNADAALVSSGLLGDVVEELSEQVRATLGAQGFHGPVLEAALDLRYRGQSYELTVPLSLPVTVGALARGREAFHLAHGQRYGYALPAETVELVTVRVRGIGSVSRPCLPRAPRETEDARAALLGFQAVWFSPDGPTATSAYDRSRLRPGNRFLGPAIVFQYD